MGKLVSRKKHDEEIEDKWGFYLLAKDYFKREAVKVSQGSDIKQFIDFAVRTKRLILKPNDKCIGSGITIADVSSEKDARKVFGELIEKGGAWIIEERLVQDDRMAQWN